MGIDDSSAPRVGVGKGKAGAGEVDLGKESTTDKGSIVVSEAEGGTGKKTVAVPEIREPG